MIAFLLLQISAYGEVIESLKSINDTLRSWNEGLAQINEAQKTGKLQQALKDERIDASAKGLWHVSDVAYKTLFSEPLGPDVFAITPRFHELNKTLEYSKPGILVEKKQKFDHAVAELRREIEGDTHLNQALNQAVEKSHDKAKGKDLSDTEKAQLKQKLCKWAQQYPVIIDYLTRPFASVCFDPTGRFLQRGRDDQEIWLTQTTFFIGPEFPFRCGDLVPPDRIKTSSYDRSIYTFYQTGVNHKTFEARYDSLRRKYPSSDIANPRDIYNIRHSLNKFELQQYLGPKKSFNRQFILFPNYKDDHATFILAILDLNHYRVLTTIFINSSQSDYYQYTLVRLNNPNYYVYHQNDMGIKDNQQVEEMLKHETNTDFVFERSRIDNKLICICNKTIPFIDASHHLQIGEDDCNCGLYVHNFIRATMDILEKPELQARILQLARRIDEGKNVKENEKALREIFQKSLKSCLPMYYDATGHPKGHAALKDHHLRLRWQVSSEWLSAFLGAH